ncbi:hypothetical protein KFU94_69095 [Chloroflexi bacterium TSY]|nr:hypothetical protein [Chloroflexi bacterium TSY]
MKFDMDRSLFEDNAHSPSFLRLKESPGQRGHELRDYCIPANPYFPTPQMFRAYQEQFEEYLKYYPEQNQNLTRVVAEIFDLVLVKNKFANYLT